MKEDCGQNCAECADECEERKESFDFSAKQNAMSDVKKLIAVVSGKGGVGKSLVTSLLATALKRRGRSVAVLDADITGPSIPRMFGIRDRIKESEFVLLPQVSREGIRIMSINLMLERETDPVVWRGPLIAKMVTQFWTDVAWSEVDCMFVDMPPGTGDVALTVFQSLPVNGIIVVTTPQELVSMVVAKAVRMAEMMKIPVLGVVENMAYFHCPECGKDHSPFGESRLDAVAAGFGVKHLARIPLDPGLARLCDTGRIEFADVKAINGLVEIIDTMEVPS